MTRPALAVLAGLAAACAAVTSSSDPSLDRDWPFTGGDPGNSRYSELAQIDRGSVHRLAVAWRYHTGESDPSGQIQATPVVVDGVLYATTAAGRLFALDAATGRELWTFDPYASRPAERSVNRGVAYWSSGADRRILFPAGSRLHAVDAATGEAVAGFGDGGSVDLAAGLGREVAPGTVVATSPGVVFGDLIVQGTRVGEDDGAAPGHVRAYDVRNGRVRWTFHTIPRPGEHGHDTWPAGAWRTAGGANSWPGLALDRERGIVYVPTGSASPDFYGGGRAGANLFANSLVALDAATGRRLWHFQTVHHDLLDRDLPAGPNLLTVERDGRGVDAVAQITKTGYVFLFDRVTGEPLFPIDEVPVPASDVPGERAWPTQPVPVKPAPFARQRLTEADLTTRTPAAHAAVLERFRTLRSEGPFTPPSLEGSVVFPGYDGGGEWGGAAVDTSAGVLYVNASNVPWIARLVPNWDTGADVDGAGEADRDADAESSPRRGAAVYAGACAACHGADREGDDGRSPSLIDVGHRLSREQIRDVIDEGRGFMPPFGWLPASERRAVTEYLLGEVSGRGVDDRRAPDQADPGGAGAANLPGGAAGYVAARAEAPSSPRSPYRLERYEHWRDPDGYPAVEPPWGTLSAIDMNTGEYLWQIPLGEHPELTERGIPTTGTEQYGGPIVTAGGLVFIAATQDQRFRALDAATGEVLWEATLPAAGYATPATYMVDGRQYVVVAAGGGKLGSPSGHAYVAFALGERGS